MSEREKWIKWAMELQSIAQAGLTYGRDKYDIQRFERIREISAEILALKSEISLERVKQLFCNEIGYQTPKLDTRAAIFKGNKILLVKERDGKWSMPGGWVDVDLSIEENTIKEVKEEAGLDVKTKKIIAMLDGIKNNLEGKNINSPYGVIKIFVLCELIGGEFVENIETTESEYFSLEEIENLQLGTIKNTKKQIKMCFDAYNSEFWETIFD